MGVWRTQVRVGYSGPGSPGFNTWHFRLPGSSDASPDDDLQAASNALRDFYDAVRNRLPTGAAIGHDALWARVDASALPRDLTGFNLVGSGADMNAPLLCYNLAWATSRPGRTGKGRTFLGPTVISAVGEAGSVVSGVRSDIAAAASSELITPFSGALDGAFCVWSPKAGVGSDFVSASVCGQFASLTTRRD